MKTSVAYLKKTVEQKLCWGSVPTGAKNPAKRTHWLRKDAWRSRHRSREGDGVPERELGEGTVGDEGNKFVDFALVKGGNYRKNADEKLFRMEKRNQIWRRSRGEG